MPIAESFEGLRRALEQEREEARTVRLDALEITSDEPDTYTFKLKKPSAERLFEEHEGWMAAGPRLEDGQYAWHGEVGVVDRDHSMLVVLLQHCALAPQPGEPIFLYEPDYQFLIRKWARDAQDEGRDLPEAFVRLAGDRWTTNLKTPSWSGKRLDRALRKAQTKAVRTAGRPFSIVWGPPGTGKTFTLGSIVAAQSLADLKVLVLAPTNVATDQAALSIDDARHRMGRKLNRGELIRPGRPQLAEMERRPHLLKWTETLRDLSRAIGGLRDEKSELYQTIQTKQGAERKRLLSRLARLNQRLREGEDTRSQALWILASEAQIVVTTLTSGLYHPEIQQAFAEQPYSLVLDEASMISRYVLAPFLELPPRHLVLCGDVRQLGPVRRNQNREDQNSSFWVGESAFDHVGASSDGDLKRLEAEGSLTMLDEQSRMQPQICEVVSRVFYQSRLKTIGRQPLPPLAPGWPAGGCVLVDGPGCDLPPFAPKGRVDPHLRDKGRECEWSAWVAIGLARSLLERDEKRSVLILTPFRSQANLLRTLARAHLSHFPGVRTGTVHVSQGLEAELVLFDPVNPGHYWLQGGFGDDAIQRLLCVAFSRPKAQILVLRDQRAVAKSPLLAQLCQDAAGWRPEWARLSSR